MIKFINAKINLGLNILRKREDGYHELKTLFYPVGKFNGTPENPEPFCDILEICLKDDYEDEYIFDGNPIDCPLEKNLVYRAVEIFKEGLKEKNIPPKSVTVFLEKHIPDSAGLGGGSADASFTLNLLNEIFNYPYTKTELLKMAARLGADCPFFIENRPMVASGIGEIMKDCDVNLSGMWAVVVKPQIAISTKEAFAGILHTVPEKDIADILKHPVEKWEATGLKNDFENNLFKIYPTLKGIKEKLYKSGAAYASMTGSGSSIFGLYRNRETAEIAYKDKAFSESACKTFLIML